MSEFTHFNNEGRARMVDVGAKPETVRTAVAQSSILLNDEIYDKIINYKIKKGDVLSVAQIAGIMAAKKTSDIIPMCHPIAINGIDFDFIWEKSRNMNKLIIRATVKTKGSTGVEMEALTAVSAASLTVYDMCKAIDKSMVIGETFLIEKTGGVTSPDYKRQLDYME